MNTLLSTFILTFKHSHNNWQCLQERLLLFLVSAKQLLLSSSLPLQVSFTEKLPRWPSIYLCEGGLQSRKVYPNFGDDESFLRGLVGGAWMLPFVVFLIGALLAAVLAYIRQRSSSPSQISVAASGWKAVKIRHSYKKSRRQKRCQRIKWNNPRSLRAGLVAAAPSRKRSQIL